ncbi:NAD-dependent protein deacetylase, SIR2 family [Halalkaliarchaeum desulfuricum]|uniref:NAD-dependent protein deacetylase, SIR2 family n=1 Tax=Halalkaliarchaeum desulfuricum TaxID=2055893 RepID=A0A343TI54_9EURY|nr:Sir2 family NAD-dependent protein deacetylase [Halalkaliarchaeum desulfuricum]AUX08776.1 NAD-dependent protein deacetylase, SIR2 family [Halalkaliarchaeum desulfuricum]
MERSDDLEALARDLREADTAIALTGAGLSAASGIPTFRGEDGIWGEEFSEADFHVTRFERDPEGFWEDRLELNELLRPDDIEPNPAHEALADLENAGILDAVVTQNTDGLHTAAGTGTVLELHGNAERVVCHRCGRRKPAQAIHDRIRSGENPPTCGECGGVYKPDVVLFGELLPKDVLGRARRLAEDSDVIVAAGSSLQVDPAASLPSYQRDGVLAIINFERTRYASRATYTFREDVTELLPALATRVLKCDPE